MPLFFLIRHGENDHVKSGRQAGRASGVHLNEKGRTQAAALAEKLAGAPVKALYSSPLERTMETAQPIAAALGLEIAQRPGLLEIDIGDWQDKTIKQLKRRKLWGVVQHSPSRMEFPGGETMPDAQRRICDEIERLAKNHRPKDFIVCVSHSDPIKLAVAYYIGLPLDMFQRIAISPGSITGLNISETSSFLMWLNYVPGFKFSKS